LAQVLKVFKCLNSGALSEDELCFLVFLENPNIYELELIASPKDLPFFSNSQVLPSSQNKRLFFYKTLDTFGYLVF